MAIGQTSSTESAAHCDGATESQSWKTEREIMVHHTDPRNSHVSSPANTQKAQPRRTRWVSRMLAALVLIGMIGWFAPMIVAVTGLRNSLPGLLLPGHPGSIEIGETSLGWFSPVQIKNLQFHDREGRPLLKVGQIKTTSSLLSLITQPQNLGTFKISQPVLHAALTDQDSNVEQVLKWLIGGKSSGQPMPAMIVEIDDAQVELEHIPSKQQTSIERISLRVVTSPDGLDEINLMVGGVPTGKQDATSIDWIGIWFGSPGHNGEHFTGSEPSKESSSKSASVKQVVVRASEWKFDRLKPACLRFLSDVELEGELTSNAVLTLAPSSTGLEWDWDGTVSLRKVLLAAKDLLSDRLRLDQFDIAGRAMTANGRLALKDFKVTSEIGDLSATGDLSHDLWSKKSVGEMIQGLLGDDDYLLRGRIDLKKLAALAPRTLRIRDGIEIDSGAVKVEFVGANVEGQRRWSGTSEVDGLKAISHGQPISWERPLAARLTAHRDRDAVVVDVLECKSEFLQILGKGTLDDAKFTAVGNLSRLAQNLERFVDLGTTQLSGEMSANGEIKRIDSEKVSLSSKILLNDLACVMANGAAWREKRLELTVSATAAANAGPIWTGVNTGEVRLVSGTDQFDLVLQRLLDAKVESHSYEANAKYLGGLDTLQNRLRPFVSFGAWKLLGSTSLTAQLTADANQIVVHLLKADVRELAAETPGWIIKDPQVAFETTGQWDHREKRLTAPRLKLAGKSLTLDLAEFDCAFCPQGISKLNGSAKYHADLVQLSSWRNLAIPNPSNYLIGTLSGTAKLVQQDQSLTGDLDAQVEKLVIAGIGANAAGAPQWEALWKEPRFRVTGRGAYNMSGDLFSLETSVVEVDGVSANAKGKLAECFTNRRIDLSGTLNYDWDVLANRFGPQTRQEIQFTGKDQRAFTFNGTLARLGVVSTSVAASPVGAPPAPADNLPDFSGEAGLGWSSGSVYGLKVGAGDISAKIEQGVCRFAPIDLPVNDGKFHATPLLYLDRSPMALVLPQEKVVDRVSLSRDLCNSWMQYVAPMLADAAQVEGKISLDLQQAMIPLGSLATGNGAGTLSVHGAQATPGALTMQIVGSINQLRSILGRQLALNPNAEQAWVELPDQQVPIRLEQGRMYHEGLTFVISNITIKTRGSVGIDTSLNMVAQIPFKDDWLGNKRGVAGLKGKSIDIPITGTVSRPQIDPKVFGNLARELGGSMLDDLIQDKGAGALDNVINNGLDKLLKGKK